MNGGKELKTFDPKYMSLVSFVHSKHVNDKFKYKHGQFLHKCTEEDWNEIYPIDYNAESRLSDK